MRRAGVIAGAVAALLLLAGCVPTASDASGQQTTRAAATSTAPVSATPTATPTAATEWRDAEALIIPPSATKPDHMPHGPSWVTAGGHLACGIYDDWMTRDGAGKAVYYGCRIDESAATLTYPPFVDESGGESGGCPSGFAGYAGEEPRVLCNGGQVFSSETDPSNVMQPGQGVRFAGVECVSTGTDAMSCTNAPHGFTASLTEGQLF